MCCKVQSVTKIPVRVSHEKRHISFENQLAAPLVVEFLKNVDFQRRYDAFSETLVQLFL